jgi:hypothetical protein
MSAAEALRAARAAGVTVRSDGECLLLEANVEPPQAVLDVLVRHKHAILDLLQRQENALRLVTNARVSADLTTLGIDPKARPTCSVEKDCFKVAAKKLHFSGLRSMAKR